MYFWSGQIVQVWWGTHSQSDESWWLCRSGTSIWVGQEEGWCWLHNGKYWQSFHDVDYTAVQPFSIIFFTKANQIHSKYYFGKSINFVDELEKKKKKILVDHSDTSTILNEITTENLNKFLSVLQLWQDGLLCN